jgi:hypothetical protein
LAHGVDVQAALAAIKEAAGRLGPQTYDSATEDGIEGNAAGSLHSRRSLAFQQWVVAQGSVQGQQLHLLVRVLRKSLQAEKQGGGHEHQPQWQQRPVCVGDERQPYQVFVRPPLQLKALAAHPVNKRAYSRRLLAQLRSGPGVHQLALVPPPPIESIPDPAGGLAHTTPCSNRQGPM